MIKPKKKERKTDITKIKIVYKTTTKSFKKALPQLVVSIQ